MRVCRHKEEHGTVTWDVVQLRRKRFNITKPRDQFKIPFVYTIWQDVECLNWLPLQTFHVHAVTKLGEDHKISSFFQSTHVASYACHHTGLRRFQITIFATAIFLRTVQLLSLDSGGGWGIITICYITTLREMKVLSSPTFLSQITSPLFFIHASTPSLSHFQLIKKYSWKGRWIERQRARGKEMGRVEGLEL